MPAAYSSQSNPQNPARDQVFHILGFPVHLMTDYDQWLSDRVAQAQGTHVVTLNAEMVMQAQQDEHLAAVIHQADLVIPDGAGIVLSLKLRGQQVRRCPGIELAEKLLSMTDQSVFFFGGAPGVAEDAAARLQQRLPTLKVVGAQNGYLSEAELPLFLNRLQTLNPQIIYVGLGVPRQEFWIAQHRALLPQALWIGVGGSFDIWAERKSRAPGWLKDNHLEWVYRLYQEPWRWRRMLALPRFAWRSLVEMIG